MTGRTAVRPAGQARPAGGPNLRLAGPGSALKPNLRQAWDWAVDRCETTAQVAVLCCLHRFANWATGECFPTTAALAARCKITQRSVSRVLGQLVKLGVLTSAARFSEAGGRQKANVFRLVLEPAEGEALAAPRLEAPAAADASQLELFGEAPREERASQEAGARSMARETSPADAAAASEKDTGGGAGADSGVRGRGLGSQGERTRESPLELQYERQSELPRARERAGELFNRFWEEWPEALRPDNKGPAIGRFLKLDAKDQILAARHAAAFRRRIAALERRVNLHEYLTLRAWNDIEEGPPLEGKWFRIAPGRPEWPAWRAFHVKRHGPGAGETIDRDGFMLRETRWPPGHDPRLQASKS